jgi:ATP-dependent Clp protease ATP-binding subunit ClpB
MFLPLTRKQIEQVVRLQIENVQKMLAQNEITLQVEDSAIDFLADAGYDPEFGARPVKRSIQRYLLNDLSKALLGDTVNKNKPIVVKGDKNGLSFSN